MIFVLPCFSVSVFFRTEPHASAAAEPVMAAESHLPKTGFPSNSDSSYIKEISDYQAFDKLVHLQWFAAEDEGRTEAPSEYKMRKAREEGRVAKSNDLNSAVVAFMPVLALFLLSGFIFRSCTEILTFFYERCTTGHAINGAWFNVFVRYFLRAVLPITLSALVSGIAVNIAQNRGFIFSTKPIQPNFSKIAPNFARFFKKAFFSGESLFNLMKSLIKVIVIVLIGYLVISSNLPRMVSLLSTDFAKAVFFIAGTAAKILFAACLFLIAFSIPDYFFQKKQFMDSLKMSKQEIKEEFKQLEGDPVVHARVRRQMQEILSRTTVKNVKEADVIITNPTHFAVAIKWEKETMAGPTVTAKGEDNTARRIKRIAADAGVPIVENKPVARGLYMTTAVGQMVPYDYFEAIAVILAGVYRTNEAKKKEFLNG